MTPKANPKSALRAFSTRTSWLVLLLPSFFLPVSCTGPQSEFCESGIVCPVGSTCAAAQATCIYDECGDGEVQPDELCDDGNIEDGDGCSADCLSTEGCGDGFVNEAAGEVCDDGNNEDGDGCSANCRSFEKCGNGIVDQGEACDDGNNENDDGCREDCLSDETCGNGVVDFHKEEVCDPGLTPDRCNDDCTSNLQCGNGIVDSGEQCDDGDNGDNTDDCTTSPGASCRAAFCGDGFIRENPEDPADEEECDGDGDGNGGETEDCNANCTLVGGGTGGSPKGCGDGVINATLGETCDDGPRNGQFGHCSETCDNKLSCGDGVVTSPEVCDPVDPISGTVDSSSGDPIECNATCTGYPAYCGDDRKDSGEACDEGSDNGDGSYNGCTRDCQRGPHCGDSNHDGPGGDGLLSGPEECDEGSNNNGGYGGCTSVCTLGPYCGDNSTDNDHESCDLGGNPDHWNVTQCHDDCSGYCGDGSTSGQPERCDLGVGGSTGYNNTGDWQTDGDESSNDRCHPDCSGWCGDGDINGDETCDAGNDNGKYAFNRADSCRTNCSGPEAFCGDRNCDRGDGEDQPGHQNCCPGDCGDGFTCN